MIVSHEHKFIFLKTKKTGGSSLEIALSDICGPDDIITPLLPNEEALRKIRKAQNWKRNSLRDLPEAIFDKFVKGRSTNRMHFFNHMEAWRAIRYLNPKIWNGYFKFSIERNPWDRQISYYYFRKKKLDNNNLTFDEFLNWRHAEIKNTAIYMIDGKMAVDHVIRYEKINEDIDELMTYLGVNRKLELPNAKGGYRKSARDYREYYTEATRQWVSRTYRTEIEQFGYVFECNEPGSPHIGIPQRTAVAGSATSS